VAIEGGQCQHNLVIDGEFAVPAVQAFAVLVASMICPRRTAGWRNGGHLRHVQYRHQEGAAVIVGRSGRIIRRVYELNDERYVGNIRFGCVLVNKFAEPFAHVKAPITRPDGV
jgi:hypothetical protein